MRNAFLIVLLAAIGCGAPNAPQESQSRERLVRVETTTPGVETLPLRVELTATVEPLYRVDVCARVMGTVAEFIPPNLDIGHRVAAGKPLLRVEVPELKAQREQRAAAVSFAESQVEQATEAERVAGREVTEAELQAKRFAADVKFRTLETERVTKLAERGSIQPERVEEAVRQLEVAKAALAAGDAAVETKKAKLAATRADLRTAKTRVTVATADLNTTVELIALATVTAPPAPADRTAPGEGEPFQYVVTRRLADRGTTVKDAAQPLLTLMHTDTVRVLIDIPERDVSALETAVREWKATTAQGDQVVLRVPALRENQTKGEFRGRVTRTAGVLDPTTRTMRAEVEFENPRGELRPGMYGTVVLTLGSRPNAITLPSSAFVRREGRTEVLVLDNVSGNPPRGAVRVVPVETGLDDGKRVQVTAGLTGKERVIVRGNTPVGAGDTVVSVEWTGR